MVINLHSRKLPLICYILEIINILCNLKVDQNNSIDLTSFVVHKKYTNFALYPELNAKQQTNVL